ncbi:T9SS type A sorting domain-containing protein [Winogradskyella sp.]|uniref:T9SS type A sorting domain-containing protein n=1 Tax=Winogradskyella sp. TaxID=1883156 RepID=UPI003BAC61E4
MKQVLLLLICILYSETIKPQVWGQTQKLVASDRASSNEFGYAVAMDGDYMVVGSRGDAVGSILKGSAYVFKNDGFGNWIEHQKILHPASNAYDVLGYDVGISGNYLIIGSRGQDYDANNANYLEAAGAAYIYEKDGSDIWNFVQKIVAPDRAVEDVFGESVAIDGNYVIIAAPWEDENVNGTNTLAYSGSAYIYERDGSGTWNFVQKITAGSRAEEDRFGSTGSVALNGNYAFVGVSREDEDETESNTISGTGSVYIYERDAMGAWNQIQKIVASDRAQGDNFGWSVNADANYLIVGAPFEDINNGDNAGAAYIFERSADVYSEIQKVVASNRGINDRFGYAVDINDNFAIIGAYNRGVQGESFAGAAYVFEKDMSNHWDQIQLNHSLDPETSDLFGFDVGLSGNYAVVGAYQEDEDENEMNTLPNSGSAYVFDANEPNTLSVERRLYNDLRLYPNPVNEWFTLDLGHHCSAVTVSIQNMLGQTIFSEAYANTRIIKAAFKQPKGIYLVDVHINGELRDGLKLIKN